MMPRLLQFTVVKFAPSIASPHMQAARPFLDQVLYTISDSKVQHTGL